MPRRTGRPNCRPDYSTEALEQFRMAAQGMSPRQPHGEKIIYSPDPDLTAEDREFAAATVREIERTLRAAGKVGRTCP